VAQDLSVSQGPKKRAREFSFISGTRENSKKQVIFPGQHLIVPPHLRGLAVEGKKHKL
jgi:hypothetical protein